MVYIIVDNVNRSDFMKRTTHRLVEAFPLLKGKVDAHSDTQAMEKELQGLSDVESTFLQLAWYFEAPERGKFDIGLLYRNLDDQWLEFSLELITSFFRDDTYLIKQPTYSMIRDGEEYLNQAQFADYLTGQGLKYDRRKINVYHSRGKLVAPDFEFCGKPYWKKSTIEVFGNEEKHRLEQDQTYNKLE
jgi:hypothetical protein